MRKNYKFEQGEPWGGKRVALPASERLAASSAKEHAFFSVPVALSVGRLPAPRDTRNVNTTK